MKFNKVRIIYYGYLTSDNAHMFVQEYQSELVALCALQGLRESFNGTDSIGIRTVTYVADSEQQYVYALKLFKEYQ